MPLRGTGQKKKQSRASLSPGHTPSACVPATTTPLLRPRPHCPVPHAQSTPALHAPKERPHVRVCQSPEGSMALILCRDDEPPVRNGTSRQHPRPPEQCCPWGRVSQSRMCPALRQHCGGARGRQHTKFRRSITTFGCGLQRGAQGRRAGHCQSSSVVRGRTFAKFQVARR